MYPFILTTATVPLLYGTPEAHKLMIVHAAIYYPGKQVNHPPFLLPSQCKQLQVFDKIKVCRLSESSL